MSVGTTYVTATYGTKSQKYTFTVKSKLRAADIISNNKLDGITVDTTNGKQGTDENVTNSDIVVKSLKGTKLKLKSCKFLTDAYKNYTADTDYTVITEDAWPYYPEETRKGNVLFFVTSKYYSKYPDKYPFCSQIIPLKDSQLVVEDGDCGSYILSGDFSNVNYDWEEIAEDDAWNMYQGTKKGYEASVTNRIHGYYGFKGTIYYGDNFVLEYYSKNKNGSAEYDSIEIISDQGMVYLALENRGAAYVNRRLVNKTTADLLGITDFLKKQGVKELCGIKL